MADNRFSHLFIKDFHREIPYIPKGGGGKINIPIRKRQRHGNFLKQKLQELWELSKKENESRRQAVALPVRTGHYIEFRSKAGFDLLTKSLENMRYSIRFSNIRKEGEKNKQVTIATVYVPSNKMPVFLKKISEYLTKETITGKPTNQKLIDSIEDIRLAVLESFWCDDKKLIPKNNEAVDYEIWLRTDTKSSSANASHSNIVENQANIFFKICNKLNNQNINSQRIQLYIKRIK